MRAGCLTSHPLSLDSPPGTYTHPNSAPGSPRTALQVLETVITVEDLHSCFRDVRPLAKVTGATGFIQLMLDSLHLRVCEGSLRYK